MAPSFHLSFFLPPSRRTSWKPSSFHLPEPCFISGFLTFPPLTASLTHSLIPKHFPHLSSPSSLPLKPPLSAFPLSPLLQLRPSLPPSSCSLPSSLLFLLYLRLPLPSSLMYLKREGPRGVLLHSGQSSCPVNLGYEQTEPFLGSPSWYLRCSQSYAPASFIIVSLWSVQGLCSHYSFWVFWSVAERKARMFLLREGGDFTVFCVLVCLFCRVWREVVVR